MNFEEIDIDRTEIAQSKLNIENKTRSNLFAWNGQFSPQFVEYLLDQYAYSDCVVIDPFLGSGTTIYECARKGISAFGMELNASAYHIAKVYEFCNIPHSEREQIFQQATVLIEGCDEGFDISTIIKAIDDNKGTALGNLLAALVVLMDVYYNKDYADVVHKKWKKLKETVAAFPYTESSIIAKLGDSKRMEIDDDSADLLITSPPYINVFNYHQKYRGSVELLGYNVLGIAKGEIGSNRKNRGNRLLTVIQYCIDMALSLKEASRVCKSNARMVYVVGRESNVLGYSFCNSKLIYNIATELLGFQFELRQERVFKNRFGQMIYEDILHFSNVKLSEEMTEEKIIHGARSIAMRDLDEKLRALPDSEKASFLADAIAKINTVQKSEAHYGC